MPATKKEMLKLIGIDQTGRAEIKLKTIPPEAGFVSQAYKNLYSLQGYTPPWIGYFTLDGGVLVGSCGFKTAPKENRVEIAYFTFPAFEGRGFGTQMARSLIEMARKTQADIVIFAQTRPEENASTAVLRKFGFKNLGEVKSPEDGLVWEWELDSSIRV